MVKAYLVKLDLGSGYGHAQGPLTFQLLPIYSCYQYLAIKTLWVGFISKTDERVKNNNHSQMNFSQSCMVCKTRSTNLLFLSFARFSISKTLCSMVASRIVFQVMC